MEIGRKIVERKGFEPSIPFRGIHAFQACSFDRSDTSLFNFGYDQGNK
jgi:hypothetical protein